MSLTLDTIVAIATLVLVVAGLFLIFGLLHVINLAHTGLMAVGVYAEVSFRGHGINTVRVRQLTFITGAALAGFAGAVLAPIQGVDPNFGISLVATGFLAVILSGRTLLGLVLSCILLGTVGTLFARYENAVWANAVVIGLAVVILRFRPQGLALKRT